MTTPLDVLIATRSFYVPTTGGYEKATRALAEGLADRGHRVRLLAGGSRITSKERFLQTLTSTEAAIVETPDGKQFTMRGVAVELVEAGLRLHGRLEAVLRSEPPDVLLISSQDYRALLLKAACRVCPERTVYFAHTTTELPAGPHRPPGDDPAARAALQQVAALVAPSVYLQRYIHEWTGRDAVVLHPPVFGQPRGNGNAQGRTTTINPCPLKGIDIFLELARTMPDVPFAAVPTWGETPTVVEDLSRLGNVEIWQAREDIDELYGGMRVLLVPSLWHEAFGLVVVEAMLRGIPVLSSDVGGLPEAGLGASEVIPVRPIEQYALQAGRIVPVEIPRQDVAPWRTALRRLLGDEKHYESTRARSRAAAEAFVGSLTLEPYEDLLRGVKG